MGNRLRFLNWLASALHGDLRGPEFDLPDKPWPATEGLSSPPYWWSKRRAAIAHYLDQILRPVDPGSQPAPALPFLTVYLLALEMTQRDPRRSTARDQIVKVRACVHLDDELRRIASDIHAGKLAPHPTWIGDLEWALLQAAGVRWPEYVIRQAGLGAECYDELPHEVGGRLLAALREVRPRDPAGTELDERAALRWAYGYLGLRPDRLRPWLLEVAAQTCKEPHRPARARRDAALAACGLWILERLASSEPPGDRQVQALREVAKASDRTPAGSLARRLLRRRSGGTDEAVGAFWATVEESDGRVRVGVAGEAGDSGESLPAPHGEAPLLARARARAYERAGESPDSPASPGETSPRAAPDFSSVTWGGQIYRFSGAIQRGVIGALWADYKAGGVGLSEETLRDASGSRAEVRFRVSALFRVKGKGGRRRAHPAIGRILHREAAGVWRLGDKMATRITT